MIRAARLPDGMPGAPCAVIALIVVILVHLVVAQSLGLFPHVTAIDFYQYWGVPASLRLSGHTLGTPYTDGPKYSATLKDYAARSDQPKLVAASRVWKRPDFAASPFLYALFAVLPADYSRALVLYYVLQILFFLTAVIVLGRLYRYRMRPVLCLAFLLVLTSGPLSSDLRVGNLGCFQLVSLTVLLALADRLRHAPYPAALGGLLLTGLTLLVLAKPNVALVGVVMVVHVWLRHGCRGFAIAAAPAIVTGAAAIAIACVYFRSWTVWQAWYGFVYGSNPYMLVRPVEQGNYSTPLLLSSWLHADVWGVAAAVAAVLIASVIALIAGPMTRKPREHAPATGGAPGVLARIFGDARLAVAIGITVTIALSPLFWYHYYLLALIPGLWLLNASSGPRYLPLYGLAALVLSSGLLNVIFLPLGWTRVAAAGAALSWLPLWGGILLRLYSTGAQGTPATPGASTVDRPDQCPSSQAPRSRHPRQSGRKSRR